MAKVLGFSEDLIDCLPSHRESASAPSLLGECGKASVSTSNWKAGFQPSASSKKWTKVPVRVGKHFGIQVWQSDPMVNENEELEHVLGEELLIPAFLDVELWTTNIKPMDHDWNDKTETDLLLTLYRSSGGRWPIVYDRWVCDAVYGTRGRTLEHLKARFYRVVTKLLDLDASHNTLPGHPFLTNRYNELYDAQRRQFNELNFSKDASTLENQTKLIKDLFRSKLRIKIKAETPTQRLGVFVAANLAKQLEMSLGDLEKVKAAAESLGVNLHGEARTLRVQKMLAAVSKQIHSLILLKESISIKSRQLESLRAAPAPQSLPKPKFTATIPAAKVKRKKNEE